mgnify:CR=1 FL=1
MSRVLIGGTASLLICVFLAPKFIEYLRRREFGQQIREEGPAGHHGKAGTPTVGGLAIFIAIAVPFLILSEYRAGSLAVLGTALLVFWGMTRWSERREAPWDSQRCLLL